VGFSSSGDPNRGIGLSSCWDLLARHGGSLKLANETSPGACFELLLPFTSEKPERPVELDPVQEVLYQPAVLVVDDDQAVREMLEDVLVELGCRVKVARDAPAATEIFPTESFEMVIIDQTLPGISGLEFAKGLRKQDPNLVLVLISGWGQEEILDKAPGAVIDLVGEKPITLEKIMEVLNQAGALRRERLHGS
jgi:two-component system, cell cycle sensor histidine kinase and response regulator CckA